MEKLGVYVHIPFCIKKCNYCDFFSVADLELVDRYVGELAEEIKRFDSADHMVDTLFFGGGTPSVLSAEQLEKIMAALRNKFKMDENAEITIEVNPATNANFKELESMGFNRVSFGVQSANNNELETLGRLHTFEQFMGEFDVARKYFNNINLDLIYGIPGQTLASWQRTLWAIGKLNPQHISAYSLIIEPGTPFFDMNLDLPSEQDVCRMYAMIKEILPAYNQYEVSNYALPGFPCRHNLKYWSMEEYVGFGANSHSFVTKNEKRKTKNYCGVALQPFDDIMGYRLENSKDILDWKQEKNEVDYLSEYMFLGLRKTEGIEILPEIIERFGEAIEKHIKNGMLIKEDNRLRFTPRSIEISNYILADFV